MMAGMPSRIVAIEDDARIRAALRLALEDEGYEVEAFESGEDTLAAFVTRSPPTSCSSTCSYPA